MYFLLYFPCSHHKMSIVLLKYIADKKDEVAYISWKWLYDDSLIGVIVSDVDEWLWYILVHK